MARENAQAHRPSEHLSIWVWLAFVVMLVLQLVVMTYWGTQKQGFHIDEVVSFQNSNGFYQHKLYNMPGFSDTWHDSEYFLDALYAHDDQRFSYDTVMTNVTSDSVVHPPLFHLALHTVMSLFPETFSKWIGIAPNMLYFAVGQVFLFLIAGWFLEKENKWLALLPCLLWGFSAGAVSIVVFIRMYCMQLMWTLGTVYCHLRLTTAKKPAKWLVLSSIFAFLCFMTHYYSIIFMFFLAACYVLFRFVQHGWKAALVYAASMLGALGFMAVCWPVSVTGGIVGSNRGTEAISNFRGQSFKQLASNFMSFVSVINRALFNKWGKGLCLLLALLLLALVIKKLFHIVLEKDSETGGRTLQIDFLGRACWRIPISSRLMVFLILLVSVAATLVVLAMIAPYRDFRYISFLLPLIVLLFFLFARWSFRHVIRHRAVFPLAIAALFACITLFSYHDGSILYLYSSQAGYDALIQQDGFDTAVCVYNEKIRTGGCLTQFLGLSRIYCISDKKIDALQEALDGIDDPGGILIYLDKKSDQDNIILTILESTNLTEYRKLFTNEYFAAYYFAV